jgi:hypothetical protein
MGRGRIGDGQVRPVVSVEICCRNRSKSRPCKRCNAWKKCTVTDANEDSRDSIETGNRKIDNTVSVHIGGSDGLGFCACREHGCGAKAAITSTKQNRDIRRVEVRSG